MSQTTIIQNSAADSSSSVGRLALRGHGAQTVPDAFPDLDANGVSGPSDHLALSFLI